MFAAAVAVVLCLSAFCTASNAALAAQTPDAASHPEINEHLWSWMDRHFIELYDAYGKPERLDHLFFADMIAMMERDGFIFQESDQELYSNSSYPESQLPRWSLRYFCTTLIGPYIDWTIQDQYALFAILRRAGIITDDYGYPPADPRLTQETPSHLYEMAKQLAYDTYGFSDDDLKQYDVLIEFQAFRHPAEPPHERWSVLWCTYHDMVESSFLVATYTIQEDRWHMALFD